MEEEDKLRQLTIVKLPESRQVMMVDDENYNNVKSVFFNTLVSYVHDAPQIFKGCAL